jgi:hypothetical protein
MTFYPIQPSPKSIAEFKQIFGKHYNKPISDEEASEGAYNLLNFFKLLLEVDQRLKSQKPNKPSLRDG